ncbi:hypothetical protein [Xenorhabdus bovienii]|uniref:hypothetical protein n=1 Tax=Xenorhabdus bovienii TaxID=40576 RepID=UPI0023B2FC9A|nr:hypothetical protein [Xenorhabdus bovienii]MDE9543243.1 hypothetical protein [Xenorhabdus bovienii]
MRPYIRRHCGLNHPRHDVIRALFPYHYIGIWQVTVALFGHARQTVFSPGTVLAWNQPTPG